MSKIRVCKLGILKFDLMGGQGAPEISDHTFLALPGHNLSLGTVKDPQHAVSAQKPVYVLIL